MTARAPTDWTRWFDDDAIRAGRPVLITTLDEIEDSLAYFRRRAVRLINDPMAEEKGTSSAVIAEVHRWPVIQAQDLSGADAITVSWAARVRVGTAGATGRLTVSGGTGTDTVDFTNTTKGWTALQTGYTVVGDGADFTPIISLHRTAGAGFVFVDNFLMIGAAL